MELKPSQCAGDGREMARRRDGEESNGHFPFPCINTNPLAASHDCSRAAPQFEPEVVGKDGISHSKAAAAVPVTAKRDAGSAASSQLESAPASEASTPAQKRGKGCAGPQKKHFKWRKGGRLWK